jgi:hypothetical protein
MSCKASSKAYPVVGTTANATGLKEAPPNRQWLGPVYFMMAAARFNAKYWPAAIADFTRYRLLFPASKRFTQSTSLLGQADLLGGYPDAAIPLFESLLTNPAYHAKALMLLVESYKVAKKEDQIIPLLEKERATPNFDPEILQKINLQLAGLQLDAKKDDESRGCLRRWTRISPMCRKSPNLMPSR